MTLLVFDCDGVLVDSEVLALDTLREMMAPTASSPAAASSTRLRQRSACSAARSRQRWARNSAASCSTASAAT
jgi:beta-phosphoglucomutase-like phosphatase (HAD superfamily)